MAEKNKARGHWHARGGKEQGEGDWHVESRKELGEGGIGMHAMHVVEFCHFQYVN